MPKHIVKSNRGGTSSGHAMSAPQRSAQLKTGALQDAIFHSAYFSSIATDENGVIQIFNVGAERMLGYAAEDVVDAITPADISDPSELVARAAGLSAEFGVAITPGFAALVFKASRGIEDIYELTYVRKDGSRFPAIVSVTALRDSGDNIIGYLLIGTDNTARKLVEAEQKLLDQQLRDQQFYTRSLIESNIDALMMTDPSGLISDVNQQMVTLTARSREALIGTPFRDCFTDPQRAEMAIRRVLDEHRVSDFELTVLASDGHETEVSYNAATFHDREGRVQGVFAAARDVTERKRIDRTLNEKNVELEHASRMKSEFLATMSHELRTPLNAIIGFSEALKDGLMGEMSANQHEYIGDIFSSGQHLLSLINDILDLSKVEAGMMELELESAGLASLLANSLSIVREKAAAQNIDLVLESNGDLADIVLDTRKTKQIVYNLLSNAVKFSRVGGRVTLSARVVAREEVGLFDGQFAMLAFPLARSEHEDFLEISVCDEGIGIAQANLGKLFQAFTQIDSTLARKFEGTGLGLAMVKQLAELHGGTVAVSSSIDHGAHFAVWLPTRAGSLAVETLVRSAPASAPLQLPRSPNALVVGDDELSVDLVRLLLEAEGFDVKVAGTADAALALAPNRPLDLITLDINLPSQRGTEFLLRLRDVESLAKVPIVVISEMPEGNLALSTGASSVLQKPIRRSDLLRSLQALSLKPNNAGARTALVVDDDPKAVELVAAFLPAPDYAVVRAYGGSEAILLAKRLRPDLILLDLMMPVVSGFDVVEALQRDAATARIPILIVTAKQIDATDRATLAHRGGQYIEIIEKLGFDRIGFMASVRRALHAREGIEQWAAS